ncbi:MAG: DUF501 domain-containing protein [Gaiellales bacterium]
MPLSYRARIDDLTVIQRQLGRPPRALAGVALRCPHGRPAVIEQVTYLQDGTPFPTGYYLTCPAAVARIARLEDAGGVRRYEDLVRLVPEVRASYAWGAARQAELRRPGARMMDGGAALGLGIAGTAHDGAVKCLHAHAAFALAQPGYELGRRILDEAGPLFPAGGCCCQ